ncbi:hypothetical protein CU669_10235 [Paramagnetospirillum kuznetsovii]|uniref:diguanylate cyclase n=1 Tax=Paramagnetospirillum kuznetsovii TaxID=2053833 RepID=A0A364NYA2_9PROT|nr:diguanylate cyclase [Paramagnetospirillum kuznetsovii]RAU22059.1 hypothetical protein CU669_10235 [Paramagnetospirillum kuznetsovii]
MRIETLARLYQSAQLLAVALFPAFAIWYLQNFTPVPAPLFENHLFHEIAIAIATVIGIFVSYVSWRSYRESGEIFLRWLTMGFLAFTVIYAPHGLLTRTAHDNIWLFLLFGPVSRLVMLGCLVYGLVQYGKPAEDVAAVQARGFWRVALGLCCVVTAAVPVLAYSPIAASPWVRMPMESGAAILCLGAVAVMVVRRIASPLMRYYGVALLLFAQAAVAFILAKPWDHMWWLAHAIFATGFSVISWGVVSALLTTKSFASAFSQEQLMRALEEEKDLLDAANSALRAERQLAQTTLDALLEHVCVIDETGNILTTNQRWQDFLVANDGDHLLAGIGVNYLAVCDRVKGAMQEEAAAAAAGIRSVLHGSCDRFGMEYACDSPTEKRWFVMSVLRADAPSGARVVIAHQDISERKRAEDQLRHLASVDGLTGVANRRAFDTTLSQEWRRACRSRMPLSLLMVDVDHFKRFNDHYGHQAGDECLRAVAGALAGAVKRPGELVARYGGEEFSVILPSCGLDDARRLAEKMRAAVLALHITHAASETASEVTISVGVSCFALGDPAVEGVSCDVRPDGLIAFADSALYRAKASGRNRVIEQEAAVA